MTTFRCNVHSLLANGRCILALSALVVLTLGSPSQAQKWHSAGPNGDFQGYGAEAPSYAREQAVQKKKQRISVTPLRDLIRQENEREEVSRKSGARFKTPYSILEAIGHRLFGIYQPRFAEIHYRHTSLIGLAPHANELVLLSAFRSPRAIAFKHRAPERWEVEEIRVVCRNMAEYGEKILTNNERAHADRWLRQYWVGFTTSYGPTKWGPWASTDQGEEQTIFVFDREAGCEGDWSILGGSDA